MKAKMILAVVFGLMMLNSQAFAGVPVSKCKLDGGRYYSLFCGGRLHAYYTDRITCNIERLGLLVWGCRADGFVPADLTDEQMEQIAAELIAEDQIAEDLQRD